MNYRGQLGFFFALHEGMKNLMFCGLFILLVMSCSTSSQQNEGENKNEPEYFLDEDSLEENENTENDSLKNRDMLSIRIIS